MRSLGDAGARRVLKALAAPGSAVALARLDLSGNELSADGVGAPLARALAAKAPTLAYLGLEENELGSAGARRRRRSCC